MLHKLIHRLRTHMQRKKTEREMDAELRFHLEMETAENIRRGMSEEEAQLAARRSFGGVEQTKEIYRDIARFRWLEDFWQDVRYGVRTLWKRPGFAVATVLTLALTIGANTAIFSVVNAVLFRPLPGYETNRFTLTGVNPPESLQAAIVTPGYFTLYRLQAAYGRLFSPNEEQPGRGRVAVLDYDFWQRRFGGDPRIVGGNIKLNQHDYTVVGIVPRDFHPLGRGQAPVYVPLVFEENAKMGFWTVARLKAGVAFEQAKAEEH